MIEERELLEHALRGYESRLKEIDERIASLSAEIGERGAHYPGPRGIGHSDRRRVPMRALPAEESAKPKQQKRVLSAEAVERIRAGQRKRWANWRRGKNGRRTARKKAA
jgi:hypothetical protein